MYLTPTLKRTLAIGGVSLLAVVGMIGWTRRGEEPVVAAVTPGAPQSYVTPEIGNPEPVSRDPNALVVYAPSPFGPESIARTAPATPVAYSRPAPRATARVRAPFYAPRTRRRYVIVRRRPFHRSAAIVGGSAAGGALIGALAGGGKGAAVGALVGGGGGLIYDRATHKKYVVGSKPKERTAEPCSRRSLHWMERARLSAVLGGRAA